MNKEDFVGILFIFIILIVVFLSGKEMGIKTYIETKKPLEYKLKIEVKNGVSDTTYIYER